MHYRRHCRSAMGAVKCDRIIPRQRSACKLTLHDPPTAVQNDESPTLAGLSLSSSIHPRYRMRFWVRRNKSGNDQKQEERCQCPDDTEPNR
jgi:hypothetical protein